LKKEETTWHGLKMKEECLKGVDDWWFESLDETAEDEAALEMDEIVDETEDEDEDEAEDDTAGMSMIVVLPNDTAGDQSSPVRFGPLTL
jgi:hypothetical protein